MKFLARAALAAAISTAAVAQVPVPFTDPANLRGERVRPHDGRELPIDISETQGGRGLEQLLRKLNTRASLMLIVAHPDDEDGGMLTFYSRGLGARVADLSLNRGEGGQNLMTGDFEDALGLLRTQELLSADRYFAVDQLFGTEVDFGFSKTKEEAFAKWTHDRVLYDAVRAVRIYRPLVIASVFIGGVTDGHGQHQVAGQIAQEVFKAAGDPKVFPELTAEGILPWQPLKVYARVPMQAITPEGLFDYATGQFIPAKFTNYVTGEVTTTAPTADVVVHEGKVDPILGPHRAIEDFLSYVQFARQGLGLQKSQIGANVRVAPAGAFDVSYHLYGSHLTSSQTREAITHDPDTASFFDGIDITLAGIADLAPAAFPALHESLAKIQAYVNVATDHLDPNNPGKISPTLADALTQCDNLIASVENSTLGAQPKANVLHELHIKREQLNDALAESLGLAFDATTTGADQPAGLPVSVWTQIKTRSTAELDVSKIWLTTAQGEVPDKLASRANPGDRLPDAKEFPSLTSERPSIHTLTALPAFTSTVTRPYFSRDNIETPVYELRQPDLRNAPQTPAAITAWATVGYKGVAVTLGRIVHDGPQAVSLIPPASITLSSHALVLPNSADTAQFSAALYSTQTLQLIPKIVVPAGWKAAIVVGDLPAPGKIRFQLDAPKGQRNPILAKASAVLPNHLQITEGFRAIGYADIPRTNYFQPATLRVVPVDLKITGHNRIAYLPGTGDAVPDALASIGLAPTILTVADLNAAALAKYDTVILGVRTYAAHPELHGAPTQALLDFAHNGGNVVVQYQTGEFTAADAPYPLAMPPSVSQSTVVDETAPVRLLDASAPLLSKPNQITPADFDGWVAERGHGFLREWDPHYTALTETHDPGGAETAPQAPQRGGLVTTALGKGHWTYCAFALYRQLPEAVPGAFRLFVNLLNP